MLTKIWIFIKKKIRKLDDLTLKHFSACNLEAIKKLTQVAMFMEAISKLTEATEKRKKGISDKHNSPKSKFAKQALHGDATCQVVQ